MNFLLGSPMRSTICIKCGHDRPLGATRCPTCGALEPKPPEEVANRILLTSAIAIGLVLAIWLAWAFGIV